MTKRKSCFSLKSLEIMICSLGETWISERLMAPWTEKKIKSSSRKKGRNQIFRLSEHVLNYLSDVQRVGNVCEKQAPVPRELSSRSEPSSLSQKRISAFRRVVAHQGHALLRCSNITVELCGILTLSGSEESQQTHWWH